MNDNYHSKNEQDQGQNYQNNSQQRFQQPYIHNNPSSNQRVDFTTTPYQQAGMPIAAFDPSTVNHYYYPNSPWPPPISFYPPLNYFNRQPIPQNTHTLFSIDPNYSSNITPCEQDSEEKTAPILHQTNRNIASPSPSKTPIPSPVIRSKRKRRASAVPVPSSSNNSVDGATKKRQRTDTDESDEEGKSVNTIYHLEKELSFLKDDCTTILIMLESLRNAFSSVQGDKSDKRCRSKTVAQNNEIQREMRIAYDDLMLQVRQLEKKMETLEKKSKSLLDEL